MAATAAAAAGPRAGFPSQELLDDLCSRFVFNVPGEDLQSFERMLFSIEQAHWFYEDKCRERHTPPLRSFTLRDFTNLLFQRCVALKPYAARVNDIFNDFTSYKFKVPVTGAIILDHSMTRCILVKGWRTSASWGFPKGKKGLKETDVEAAVREVLEETGFDISTLVNPLEYLEVVAGQQQQRSRLFVVAGVDSRTAVFQPQTVKEISEIAWHLICDLATAQCDGALPVSRTVSGAKLFMVQPFVRPLLEWIDRHQHTPDSPPPCYHLVSRPPSTHPNPSPLPPLPPSPTRPLLEWIDRQHTPDSRQLAVHMMPQNVPGSIFSVWKTSTVLPASPQTSHSFAPPGVPASAPVAPPPAPTAAAASASAAPLTAPPTAAASHSHHPTIPATTTAVPHIPTASPSSLRHPVSSRHVAAARKQLFPADSPPLSTSASSGLLPAPPCHPGKEWVDFCLIAVPFLHTMQQVRYQYRFSLLR
ncbi:unnamed protein product [Closterium sp. Naga37s-1]|nr:unnamed protein product [Closterium sp. Naga37s-1]